MRFFIILFGRFGNILLLLLLESIAFYFVVLFNDQQQLILFSSANRIVGSTYEVLGDVKRFFYIGVWADSLNSENARLRTELERYQQPTFQPKDSLPQDTSQVYKYVSARVINNSINKNNNYLTINRGKKHGISEHMGVITSKGAVGIVLRVTDNYAQVMSILHRNAQVNAAIRRSGYFGPLVWRGKNPKKMLLKDIPLHADILVGDTIHTTGYSTIFPTGIPIGIVDTFRQELGSYAYEIDVELFEDLSKIRYVYVVNFLKKEEIRHLESEIPDE
nr:rod shape-determining protein MreC [Desulfobacula sp.]